MDKKNYKIRNWKSETIIVDVETGVLIGKAEMKREYIKLKTTKKYEIHGNQGIIKYTIECERSRQQKLFR